MSSPSFLCSFDFSQAIDDPFVEDKNKKSLKCVDLTCYDKTQSKYMQVILIRCKI